MKGFIFTTFFDFIESQHGPDALDEVIDAACVPNDGAYTAVGTYPHGEFFSLLNASESRFGRLAPEMLVDFGKFLGQELIASHPHLFNRFTSMFDLLSHVNAIHESEVRKLHPDAELPVFRIHRRDKNSVDVDYLSRRALDSLAEGILYAVADLFETTIAVRRQDFEENGMRFVRFSVTCTDQNDET